MRSVFFVDDNLIGNVPQAKSLLRFLADDQKPHNYEFSFGTESSLNLAQNRGWLCPPCRHCCRQPSGARSASGQTMSPDCLTPGILDDGAQAA